MTAGVHLGFEMETGTPVSVPISHLAVTGQTQASGKTTTLEGLVARSGLKAIAFVTKRFEGSFRGEHNRLAPYFRERADWQTVASILEATMREKMRLERSWIMRACKGAKTLKDVQRSVQRLMLKAKGMSADIYMTLDHYLDIVIPQIDRLPYTATMTLMPGLNVMDLSAYTMELQALVIRSAIEWVYEDGRDTLVIIPEAWEFIPQSRGSPVLLACEQLIRKGGAGNNHVWLDSQDIAGVHKSVLRQVGVWILGVQREAHEVKRTLAHITGKKPSVDDVMQLERGQFFVCHGRVVTKTYVQPEWMDAATARDVALGEVAPLPPKKETTAVDQKEATELREHNAQLIARVRVLESELADLRGLMPEMRSLMTDKWRADAENPLQVDSPPPAGTDVAILYQQIKRMAITDNDARVLALLRTVPELVVTVERRTIDATDATLFGKLAALIADNYFDTGRTGNAAFEELKRRGASTAKPNVYRECDKLAGFGFLTKESDGYRAVPGMKVRIVERDAAA